MPKRIFRHFLLLLSLLLGAAVTAAHAGEHASPTGGTMWDTAVNSLLATGMYGFDAQGLPGLTMQLQHSAQWNPGLDTASTRPFGQAITFSYEGSAGLLGFSAGYILTTEADERSPGTVFLGLDPQRQGPFDPARSWYLAFDLSRSYQVDEDLTLQLGNTTMLLKNPFDTEEGQLFSLLFNMPISYRNYLTITPMLQWTRPVDGAPAGNGGAAGNVLNPAAAHAFYGGISISFSY
ncbi:MAG: hypothetical protein RBS95_01155 [Desulfobulbus sp.]|jgi:hypothetical protein|nr:hypothetical protein [Desulfobulbus sp.]